MLEEILVCSGKKYGRYFWKALFWSYRDESHTHVIFTKKGQVAEHIQLDTAYTEFKNIQNKVMYFLGINKSVVKL